MADVLPPFSQPTSTITMLHSRSASDTYQGSPSQYQSAQRSTQAPRSMYNGQPSGYRGTAPSVQPYAFQATPQLRQDSRSAPSTSHGPVTTGLRHKHSPSASASTTSSDTSHPSARDDSVMGSSKSLSGINLGWQLPDLTLPSFENHAKASPERYRRPAQKRTDSNTTTLPHSTSQPLPYFEHDLSAPRHGSVDDLAMARTAPSELAKRYRRRSLNQLETANIMNPPNFQTDSVLSSPAVGHGATSTPTTIRPVSFHEAAKTLEGEGLPIMLTEGPSTTSSNNIGRDAQEQAKTPVATPTEQRSIQVPPRGSSEPNRRLAGPSPLSRQADDNDARGMSPTKPKSYAAAAQSAMQAPSAAAAQLAAVSDKDLNKGMKSRLRRAFSFGSAQELRRAAGEGSHAAAQQARQQHRQTIDDELDAEQLEIARRQEAAGIGAGIYSGQGGFAGSTDNLSISSTASSASMMLRKMGRGAKKGAKSIKGLFRPKSVIGVPAADGPVQTGVSLAEVSMVTVEAERQIVNVNAHPEEMVGGGTGFPKLDRNSLDAACAAAQAETHGSLDGSDSHSRRSVVGSEKDRAEVLAAVKKGILKRSGTASPTGSPTIRASDGSVSRLVESPAGTSPGTPRDASKGGRSVSTNTPQSDYFVHKGHPMAKSVPNTPNGSVRGITFSPRIQFHDVWSSSEYDRRSEVATCNRLTPLLAQQIKEELNTFKMEMEVHELSKPHTHFF